MEYVSFSDEEKAERFDRIASLFYNANFGQASKADIELLMFDIYIKKIISDNENDDGTIDYRKCSDYKISKDLGITQQRVRNLKVKNQLVHPIEFDWKAALATLTCNARYDSNTKKITINIPDPNLFYEIQNFIEEQGAYVEMQLNSKILQIRVEYYIELILAIEPENTRKEVIKLIKSQLKGKNKNELKFDEKDIGRTLINLGIDALSIAESLSDMNSPGAIIWKALKVCLSNI